MASIFYVPFPRTVSVQISAQGSETITATIRDSNSVEIETVKYVRDK